MKQLDVDVSRPVFIWPMQPLTLTHVTFDLDLETFKPQVAKSMKITFFNM